MKSEPKIYCSNESTALKKNWGHWVAPTDAEVHLISVTARDQNWLDQLQDDRRERLSQGVVKVVHFERPLTKEDLEQIGRAEADYVLAGAIEDRRFQDVMKQARKLHQSRKKLREGLEFAQVKYRELVRDRTKVQEESRSMMARRVAQLRDLVQFMQELAKSPTLVDVLTLLRREWRSSQLTGEPTLGFSVGPQDFRILFWQNDKLVERRLNTPWPASLRIRHGAAEDARYLANILGRPVGKVLTLPFPAKRSDLELPSATLFIEPLSQELDVDHWLPTWSERLQAINVALDRLLLDFELKSATYLWEHTFDGLEDAIAIVDLDHRLLRSNRAFASQALRQCFRTFQNREIPCAGCPLPETLSSQASQQSLVHKGDRILSVHSYPILLAEGRAPTTAVNHYVDVTEALGLQQQMVQSEKMVALGHLAGHIAHELNNPLTGIRSLAQFWQVEDTSEQVRSDFREIEKAAVRSQKIIENLLGFARAGEAVNRANFSFSNVIKDTVPLLKSLLARHRFEVRGLEEPVPVRGDPQLLQQVIYNLLKNACQAMSEKGDLTLTLKKKDHDEAAGALLAIQDTGSGIPKDQLERIFSPFVTTKVAGEGTGLGLSISRNLVRKMGGELWVQSQLGQGSTFYVWLPSGGA